MPVYTTKLTVSLSLREVREVFDDPFKFAGVSGHINLLMGLRSQDDEPFFFDQADSPPTRFRASFLLGTPRGQTLTYFGTFEKVQLPSLDMISYKGKEDRRSSSFRSTSRSRRAPPTAQPSPSRPLVISRSIFSRDCWGGHRAITWVNTSSNSTSYPT